MFHCFCPNISTFKDFHCTGHGITKLPPTSTGVVRVTPSIMLLLVTCVTGHDMSSLLGRWASQSSNTGTS